MNTHFSGSKILQRIGIPIFAFETIDSTNNEAKRMLATGFGVEALVVANGQSAGRGRMGRDFYSPVGTGVYMTLILRPNTSEANMVSLTTMAAVATAQAIEAITPLRPQIKWVNDLYLNGKKFCGILAETVSGTGAVIVGIGINVCTKEFPEGIEASSMMSGIKRDRLIAEIVVRIRRLADNMEDKSYIEDYRARSMVLGKQISYVQEGITYAATAVDIREDGGLLITGMDGKQRVLCSGEISLRVW